jgi:hypothetical protein
MNVSASVGRLFEWGPVLFGIGFLAPLVTQSMNAASMTAPLGLGNLAFGLAVGLSAGVVAKWRGRWI